jgi:flagellin-like hook-associated protein FlgL
MTSRLAVNFTPAPGAQSLAGIQAEIANAQIVANTANDRHKQSTATLTDLLQSIENVSPDEVGTQLLALQTALQASLQTTAMLSKLSLVNYI